MISAEPKITRRNSVPIEITAQHAGTGKVLAGPLRGRLFDLTKNSACLLLSEIMDHNYHFFYSTQENSLLFLNIFLGHTANPDEDFKVRALPLWFNIFQQGQRRNFIMGVEFTRDSEGNSVRNLLNAITEHHKRMS
ncbi:MAG: hypothetical protein SD837_03330 [Candidatus Electrothrix scaldis]|nr:MAG: hypothetical protein SD837_03330 [Candidatus Electrothrix sp. GW3-3]